MFRTLLIGLLLSISSVAHTQDKKEKPANQEITDSVAQRDFQFQGEYQGEIGPAGEQHAMGMQVIAVGNGQFKFVAYPGGLPGDGWNGEVHEEIDVLGKYNEEKNAVEVIGYRKGDAVIKDGVLSISTKEHPEYGQLKKVVRKSETLGAEPPEGAVVLFDGSGADGWKNGKTESSEITLDDGLSEMRTSAGTFLVQGTTSEATFGDHSLHLEFRLPFMPNAKGQGRGNSGMYVQGRYEVQMLDSFGLEGKNNECGGIYSVKDTDLNMCYPPMSWQTYDVDFTAAKFDADGKQTSPARMTVRHNGVVIHNDVELPARKTTAAPVNVGPENGPIYLQNHGNQVRYRNIWVMEK